VHVPLRDHPVRADQRVAVRCLVLDRAADPLAGAVPNVRPIRDSWSDPYVTSTVSHSPSLIAAAACCTWNSKLEPPVMVESM
jgi:hypothetical protein